MVSAARIPVLLDALLVALTAAGGPPVRREPGSSDHVLADPPLPRADLVRWLFEGRHSPPAARLRPDPAAGPDTDPHRRYLFRPTAEDVRYLRPEFRQRWLDTGPGWFIEGALPSWVPADVKQVLGETDRSGGFRRSLWPVVLTFQQPPPYGQIVAWYGPYDFTGTEILFCYQEFPTDLQFYRALRGVGDQQARLLHKVYTEFNLDMRDFVLGRGMRPDKAREELQRIWGGIFRTILEGAMTIVTTGAGVGSANRIAATVDRASDAVRASFRLNRQLFSLWARERSIWTILYRGATLGRIFRDVTRDLEHDLGAGTYFTTLKRLATFFSRARATESSRAVLLRLAVRKDMLGSTLDLLDGPLAKEWAETVAVRNAGTRVPLVNEQYNRLVQDFLQCKGTSLEKFDTVIAWDYLHDGPQICIKNDELARKLLLMAEEISP